MTTTISRVAALVSEERVKTMAVSLSQTTASPEFLRRLEDIRDAPGSEKMATGQRVVEEVKRELPLPDDFRFTTRKFEMPPDAVSYFDPSEGVGSVVYDGGIITVVDGSSGEPAPGTRESASKTQAIIRNGVEDIGRFVRTPSFVAMLEDLYSRPPEERPAFVTDVILRPEQRAQRGISVPGDLLIQRSAFGDGRPTLFCVVKLLPLAYPWQKITITFDS